MRLSGVLLFQRISNAVMCATPIATTAGRLACNGKARSPLLSNVTTLMPDGRARADDTGSVADWQAVYFVLDGLFIADWTYDIAPHASAE